MGFVELKYLKDFRTKKYSDIITNSKLIKAGKITFIGYYVYRDVWKFMKYSLDAFMDGIKTTASGIQFLASEITDVLYSETPMTNLLSQLTRVKDTVKKPFFSLFSGNIVPGIKDSIIQSIQDITNESEVIQLTHHMIDIMSDKNKNDPILMSLSPSMTNEQTKIIKDYVNRISDTVRTVPNIELGTFKDKIVKFIKVAIQVHELKDIVEKKHNNIISSSLGSSISQQNGYNSYNSNSNNERQFKRAFSLPSMGGKRSVQK